MSSIEPERIVGQNMDEIVNDRLHGVRTTILNFDLEINDEMHWL